jgi:hypothetical protein
MMHYLAAALRHARSGLRRLLGGRDARAVLIHGPVGEAMSMAGKQFTIPPREMDFIHDAPGPFIHARAMVWVTNLVIDLKLQLAGHKPQEPITMERLNIWTQLYNELARCEGPREPR